MIVGFIIRISVSEHLGDGELVKMITLGDGDILDDEE